jgi:hypothetical protein
MRSEMMLVTHDLLVRTEPQDRTDTDVRGLYRNNKTGNIYLVLHEAVHSETQEEMVVYERDDKMDLPPPDDERIWVRPKKLFNEKFTFVKMDR